jgi:hypothetical protein
MHGRGPEPLQLDHFGKAEFLIVRTGLQIGSAATSVTWRSINRAAANTNARECFASPSDFFVRPSPQLNITAST